MPKNRLTREGFSTRFWQNAYQSLPPHVRERHAFDMKAAERWELGLGAVIEFWSRAAQAAARLLHAPRPTH
jgi:hypothetical protein